jgi:hypothetical protein
LNKIPTLTFSAARSGALPPTTQRSDGAGRKMGYGERECPPRPRVRRRISCYRFL